MPKTIILPRAWGLTRRDAERICDSLGISGIKFLTLSRGSRSWTPQTRLRDQRGARFINRVNHCEHPLSTY